MNSVFGSIEAEAWCRDFSYEDYKLLHKRSGLTAEVISEKTYKLLCSAFDSQVEEDMEK